THLPAARERAWSAAGRSLPRDPRCEHRPGRRRYARARRRRRKRNPRRWRAVPSYSSGPRYLLQMARKIDVDAAALGDANGQRVEARDEAYGFGGGVIRREGGQSTRLLLPVVRHEYAGILVAKIRGERAQPDCGVVRRHKQEGRV